MTRDISQLKAEMPAAYQVLVDIAERLEKHYRDMQDMAFTIEDGRLWMLQTHDGKRTAQAAVRIAVDMACPSSGGKPWVPCCRSSATTLPACSGPWTACR